MYTLKIILYVLLGVLMALLAYVLLLIISAYVFPCKYSDKNSRYHRFLLNSSVALLCFFMRIRIHKTGMEQIPEDTRFLLVSNHLSNFDPLLEWLIFRKYDIAFISKPDNFKIPAYGRLIRECCFMPINRENAAEASKTLKRAESLIKANEVSIGVYPEGTRGDGSELLPFHNGMFYVAKGPKVPIVVATLRGTSCIAKNFPLHGTDVYLDVVDVIDTQFISENRTTVIGERVKAELEKVYPQNK